LASAHAEAFLLKEFFMSSKDIRVPTNRPIGPIKQGSVLHRVLELIAREIAKELVQNRNGAAGSSEQPTTMNADGRTI
jgi:hypothetical protein